MINYPFGDVVNEYFIRRFRENGFACTMTANGFAVFIPDPCVGHEAENIQSEEPLIDYAGKNGA